MRDIAINPARLRARHEAMAKVGATGRGGINRQALTAADIEARALLLNWAAARGFRCAGDQVGNLFITRAGDDPQQPAVLSGSHLDSQPTGGNFDGVFGVLAALEVLETLEDSGVRTRRSVQLVDWTNEEGSRFSPTTMGSAVFAGALGLDEALRATDRDGICVADALDMMWRQLPPITRAAGAAKPYAYIEAHIEQGPILESTANMIGVVTGIQGLRSFAIEVRGQAAHAGTTPMSGRHDAFAAAVDLATQFCNLCHDPDDRLRFTIGRFDVSPGAPNTVPDGVQFTIDLRHPDDDVLKAIGDRIVALSRNQPNAPGQGNQTGNSRYGYEGAARRCKVSATELLYSHPVRFAPEVVATINRCTEARGYPHVEIFSGATHDAKFLCDLCPTGMIFIPCRGGISHSEDEMASEDHITAGTQLLTDAILELAEAIRT